MLVYGLVLLLLIVANVINLGGDLGAVTESLQLVMGNGVAAIGSPELLYAAAFASAVRCSSATIAMCYRDGRNGAGAIRLFATPWVVAALSC